MKIAIVAAMAEELAPFREVFSSTILWEKGKTKIEAVNPQLFLVQSGIGKANAAATSAWLCEKVQPDLMINTGSTGSFRKDFALGDVVYTNQFIYSDVDATGFDYAFGQVPQMPAGYPVEKELLETIEKVLKAAKIPAHQGMIVTSDSFMSDEASIATIRQRFPEIAASDMESCAVAQIAYFYEIPVLNLRGISDHVGDDAAATFDKTIDLAAEQAFKAVKALVDYWQKV
ncbi:5'-methylthioadenosine/adenosylhomocysteine nucleosidase [Enterococcus sp. DIV1314a]|uniref:5'-methylthioadenosine/adenosylhomocysteine nucleosidase n=1 Tax=Enterococcus sp. DIV1314a TaxID=2774660 RepID=UPI003F68622F